MLKNHSQIILHRFATGRAAGGFHHRDHVRLCWIYLRQGSPLEVLARLAKNLKAFARAQGMPDLYHETITWAYVFLVHERMGAPDENWERFAARTPELLSWKPSLLDRYYTASTLDSDGARASFVLPDRLAAI